MKALNKILYVEDEADIRMIAQISLVEIGGYNVRFCASGAEAIACAQQFKPDLLVLDVMMPDMDGITTLANLQKISDIEEVPFIFMTAKVQPAEVKEYKQLGALNVISKPFDSMNLAAKIQTYWDEQHG